VIDPKYLKDLLIEIEIEIDVAESVLDSFQKKINDSQSCPVR
jgi:hypothetical protein